ncbi:hypothetical protein L1987_09550 [Smallanthus sonchifolius]|uniref:Uncharacterized protein n=1 Tax=Smallanthus sonchifolius TaxID=185202 RepID=A0ACB9JPP5_9ASTR|nr:hypothetical protein L1987_09550 [Smallanthus sonchifolius]
MVLPRLLELELELERKIKTQLLMNRSLHLLHVGFLLDHTFSTCRALLASLISCPKTLVKHTQIQHTCKTNAQVSRELFFPSVLLSDPPPPPPAIVFSGGIAKLLYIRLSQWSTIAARSIFSLLLNPRWRWWVVAMVVVDLGQPKSSDS